ncbi:hypothetical protein [Candidatus Nitrososphaera gargensis]|uniref:hypothetical protein n=1 Tax=Candidatus Nitrososphaera gargensis TaxID=497727 RepID=UPI001650C34D|nr:hypothetical protein [Candidatus Nitrososphaera gargensis]
MTPYYLTLNVVRSRERRNSKGDNESQIIYLAAFSCSPAAQKRVAFETILIEEGEGEEE